MPLDLDKANEAIILWDQESNQDIKSLALKYGIKHRPDSPNPNSSVGRIRSRLYRKDGVVNKVSKVFRRSLVYVHKGAGKGRGGSKGSKWVDKYGNTKTTNPASLGKMGTGGRVEKPFINESLDGPKGVDELATVVAEHLGDAIAGSLFVK